MKLRPDQVFNNKWLTKTPDRRHWRLSSVFTVNFEHISDLQLYLKKDSGTGVFL